uniref:Uncharacterized protein n=1 Tax=Candidatus Kentrum sp. MB TaxID=2138164 RepID=A0A451BEU5_9GAMM|nr:MAG: hypothetical protein BECKMB1821G_GA0114241_107010 [Candidatus Kentron sp. MB]VFK34511.1 MAG: hypothetical protein BECKMB1821I_GA0114274_10746 [Candidatus Kentron sp. MB]VFK76793.1 MAG: hypothetical protein BECKMB1821H_GA0114242_10756 [Candidatus Kentron sp. MB]
MAITLLTAQQRQDRTRADQPPAPDQLTDKDQRIRELTQAVAALRDANAASEVARKQAEALLEQLQASGEVTRER